MSSLLKSRLEKEGFEVSQSFDGEEAINHLSNARPDLILLDLIMPKKSGFEVLESLSINPELKHIPVVIVTNLAQDEDYQKVKNLGAAEYFVKARTSIDELIGKVKEITSVQKQS